MAGNSAATQQDPMYTAYVESYKISVEGKRDASKSYDQALLTLSAGALGVSVTFVQNFVPDGKPTQYQLLLFAAWVLFTIALSCTLTSFLTAHEAYRVALDKLDQAIRKLQAVDPKNRLSDWTYWLNRSALVFFILGVFCLILFVALNLPA
jgi:hypothetical protein